MRAIRMTYQTDTGVIDIKNKDGKALFCEAGTQTAQHGAQRLHLFQDESVIGDPDEDYTDWYDIIWNMQKSQAEKEFELKRRILGTPGVLRIINFTWRQDDRTVYIESDVQTEWGEETVSGRITPL